MDAAELRQVVGSALCEALLQCRKCHVPAFEAEFRDRLKRRGCWLERQGASQWKISCRSKDEAAREHYVYASVRVEARPALERLLRKEVRNVRRCLLETIRHPDPRQRGRKITYLGLLYDHKWSWSIREVAEEVLADSLDNARTRPAMVCSYCEKDKTMDLLGGMHFCRIVATYRCPECQKIWTSLLSRYDPREERVLGQDCEKCQVRGQVQRSALLSKEEIERLEEEREKRDQRRERQQRKSGSRRRGNGHKDSWQDGWAEESSSSNDDTCQNMCAEGRAQGRADNTGATERSLNKSDELRRLLHELYTLRDSDSEEASKEEEELPRIHTDVHRSELCEACKRFGNCSGTFTCPFDVEVAVEVIKLRMEKEQLQEAWPGWNSWWTSEEGERNLRLDTSLGAITMLPHISQTETRTIAVHPAPPPEPLSVPAPPPPGPAEPLSASAPPPPEPAEPLSSNRWKRRFQEKHEDEEKEE